MILTFVGKDGSMNLKHGKKYNVEIKSGHKVICVYWKDMFGRQCVCPYSSPQTFAANWTK